jgi:hypothetical protein
MAFKNTKNFYLSSNPDLFYPGKSKAEQARHTKLIKEGKIRAIGPRLYTSAQPPEVEAIVRANWSEIVSRLFPRALVSHRSALEFKPSPSGEIFLTASTNRQVHYPGLTLTFIRGPGPLTDDPPFLSSLHTSSLPRALLENLSVGKKSAHRALTAAQLEEKLEVLLQARGEKDFSAIRSRARAIAVKLGWAPEYKKLDALMGALLGSRSAVGFSSPSAKARAQGRPYDSAPLERFDLLFGELSQNLPPPQKEIFKSPAHFRNKAFFDAYFSNYIEGTTFDIEEAESIAFGGKIPEARPKDAHDILGTFQIVSDPNEMRRTPVTFAELEHLLKSRHHRLMGERPEAGPGVYKVMQNRAGQTYFTPPELVAGTLEKGFDRYRNLPAGFARAVFMMFLITEVHPFIDGNGRLARIMMNAELNAEGLSTIIVPTVYREDYLLSLRALSRRNRPAPLQQMAATAQKFSALDFKDYPTALKLLVERNWFQEPDEAKIILFS